MSSSREKLNNYLRQIVKIFVTKVPDTYVNDKTITDLTIRLSDDRIEKMLNNIDYLNQIVTVLISAITGDTNEPLWNIVDVRGKQYFIPSVGSIEKYDINSSNGDFIQPEYEIAPIQQNDFISVSRSSSLSGDNTSTESTPSSSPRGRSSPTGWLSNLKKGGKRKSKRRRSKRRKSNKKRRKTTKYTF